MASIPSPHNRLELPAPSLNAVDRACKIWKGDGRRPVGFWLLGRRLQWYGVHWIDGRGMPCLASIGACKPCEDAWLPRRVAYICGMHAQTGGRYLLRISEYAYRNCPVLAIEQNWAGTAVIVRRLTDAVHAGWMVEVPPATPARPALPPPVDVIGVLSRVWGIDLRRVQEDPPKDGDLTPQLRPYEPTKLRKRTTGYKRGISDV